MQTNFFARRAQLDDLQDLHQWYNDVRVSKNMYMPPEGETDFAVYMLRPYRYMVVAGDAKVGTFTLVPQGEHSAIVGILLAPEFRGRGYSKEVMRLLEEAARSHGFKVLTADIYTDNTQAVSTFLANGYRAFQWFEKNLT